ncbi:MAG TPA: right-handed parallel beta-helix repeat-containing protein [Gaiellales bacterium]
MRMRALLTVALFLLLPASAQAADLYVNASTPGCSDAVAAAVAQSAATPWCSPAPAAQLAQPGDIVHIASGTYAQQLRPVTSGTEAQPIIYQGEGAVTLAAPTGSVGVMLVGVHDIKLRELSIQANGPQGIWLQDASRILIGRSTVTNHGGVGIQIKSGSDNTVAQCNLADNAKAGLLDMDDAQGTTLSGSIVTGNGHDGQKYDGDGVELNSSGALVTGNRIQGNGDSVGFEHGIYAGSAARGYTIVGNSIEDNAGADVKAAGGPALVTGNRLRTSLFGVVVSDNPAVVTVQYNLIQGRFEHGILVTTGRHSAARARFWNNTVEQTGRLTGTGNASAVFVVSAGLLALRNNLLAYTNPDGLGQAVMIDSRALVGSFTASNNWYADTDPAKRRLAWNGSLVTLGQWRRLSGQDATSIASPAPRFGPGGRVVSHNAGVARGLRLGLARDLAGTRIKSGSRPDIGAFQHRS